MIRLTIDGQPISVEQGSTILEAARRLGIRIPTLCHVAGFEKSASCFLCAVQIEGQARLSPSCAMPAADGMVVHTNSDEVRAARKMALELLLSDHVGDCIGPCRTGCPARFDIPGFLTPDGARRLPAVRRDCLGLPHAALRARPHLPAPLRAALPPVRKGRTPLGRQSSPPGRGSRPGVRSPLHPAQGRRPRGKEWPSSAPDPPGSRPHTTCSGAATRPSSSTAIRSRAACCAGESPRSVCRATCWPRRSTSSVCWAASSGWRSASAATSPWTTCGATSMPCSSRSARRDSAGWTARARSWRCRPIEFLEKVALGRPPEIGDDVVILGGGNTAMDAARTAVRLGAKNVRVLYRRTRREMPCLMAEVEAAEAEGVQLETLVAPVRLDRAPDGRLRLITQRMELGPPDESGRPRPVPVPGSELPWRRPASSRPSARSWRPAN